MSFPNPVVTIDGPAASGKSSVSREIAKRLSWNWVSTGAFYRGLAFVSLQEEVDSTDEKALGRLAKNSIWSVEMTSEKTAVLYKNSDVTAEINSEKTGSVASVISQYPEVRAALLQAQRDCGLQPPGLIAEGRDCGTVVFPNALLKVYLTARSEDRAKRRAEEQGLELKSTVEEQKMRDERDTSRASAPLQIPENALVIDTSELGFEEVVSRIETELKAKLH